MIPLCNLHTHTTFCDGKNTAEENVLEAIRQGCITLGFSGHAPANIRGNIDWCIAKEKMVAYRDEILRLKHQYSSELEIAVGLELDYFSPKPNIEYEYSIGSVHYVKVGNRYIPVDNIPEPLQKDIDECYSGDFLSYAKDYFEFVSQIVDQTNCSIVGHFDLLTKFNEKTSFSSFFNEENPVYRKAALDALDNLLDKDVLIEINTGAISRGWRTVPYPAPFILKRIAEKGGRVILNSDAHSAKDLFCAYEETVTYIHSCGINEIWIYKNKQFVPIPIIK